MRCFLSQRRSFERQIKVLEFPVRPEIARRFSRHLLRYVHQDATLCAPSIGRVGIRQAPSVKSFPLNKVMDRQTSLRQIGAAVWAESSCRQTRSPLRRSLDFWWRQSPFNRVSRDRRCDVIVTRIFFFAPSSPRSTPGFELQ